MDPFIHYPPTKPKMKFLFQGKLKPLILNLEDKNLEEIKLILNPTYYYT